jgi:hypothetical protein
MKQPRLKELVIYVTSGGVRKTAVVTEVQDAAAGTVKLAEFDGSGLTYHADVAYDESEGNGTWNWG